MGHVWLRSWEHTVARLEVRGDGLIADALSRGRGVLVLAPHLGNWEVVGLHLATLGPTVALYQPLRLAALGPMVTQARQRTGAKLVPTNKAGLGALLRALHGGGIAGILPDQVPDQGAAGCNVPFMGVPCFTGALANGLLRKTGALAIMAYAERVRGGFILRYRVAQGAVSGEDLYLALAALNRDIEACLAQCPEQYQWEYKRFRTRPGPGGSREKQDSA
jgi:KDO2-lipid IV(A) lauroyltransferase